MSICFSAKGKHVKLKPNYTLNFILESAPRNVVSKKSD